MFERFVLFYGHIIVNIVGGAVPDISETDSRGSEIRGRDRVIEDSGPAENVETGTP